MSFLIIVLGFLFMIFAVSYKWIKKYFHMYKYSRRLPGPLLDPITAYIAVVIYVYFKKLTLPFTSFVDSVASALCLIYKKEGVVIFWVIFRPIILLFKPETVEPVLSTTSTNDKSAEYEFLHAWLGTGLLTSSGEKWKSRRKLLTPSFHFRILEDFIPAYNEHSQFLVKKLKVLSRKEWIDIAPIITMCTLDIICETIMGVQINAQVNADSEYVKAVQHILETILRRLFRPWQWIQWMYYLTPTGRKFQKNLKIVHGLTSKVIREKKALLLSGEGENFSHGNLGKEDNIYEGISYSKRRAFLELLLAHHFEDPNFTEEDIREEVDTFMFEGHDTTAAAVSWALYNVGLLPEVQENIFKELDVIFGDDKNRPVTSDDMKSMKYLECVLKESLRLYPSVPLIARNLKHDVKIGDYTLASGATCVICIRYLHRHPDFYPNPEVFDPNRFSQENCAGRHPYAYIPFSAGPRNCIGQKFALMEEKTILANIFRNFKVRSLDQRDVTLVIPDVILKNVNPIRMKFIPR